MKRLILYAVLLVLLFLLQTSAFRAVMPLTGVTPNLLLILVSSFGFLRGDRTGILLGFFAGLMVDLVFADYLGFHALLFMFLGFLAGKFYQSFLAGRIALAVALIAGTDFLFGFISYVLLFLLRARFHFRFYLLHVILPEMVFTLAVALFLYPLIYLINEVLEAQEIRRAKKFV